MTDVSLDFRGLPAALSAGLAPLPAARKPCGKAPLPNAVSGLPRVASTHVWSLFPVPFPACASCAQLGSLSPLVAHSHWGSCSSFRPIDPYPFPRTGPHPPKEDPWGCFLQCSRGTAHSSVLSLLVKCLGESSKPCTVMSPVMPGSLPAGRWLLPFPKLVQGLKRE